MAASTASTASVSAVYTSSADTQTFDQPLPSAQPTDTASKIAYLAQLRRSTKQLQDQVNAFLTAKMEEDRAASSSAADAGSSSTAKSKAPDEEEEENYGEEKVDDE